MEKIFDILNQLNLPYEEKLKIGSVIIEGYFSKEEERKNENKIIWGDSSDKVMAWDEAKEWCEKQGGRLPKMWELVKAYEEKEEGFVATTYWSSTEYSILTVWYVNFHNGNTGVTTKMSSSYVRCIFDK
jgi:hypothetical protein